MVDENIRIALEKCKKILDYYVKIQPRFVVVNNVSDKWDKEREKWIYRGVVEEGRTQREILKSELIIEYDSIPRANANKLIEKDTK
ncbi:MAG: hypothetical protein IID03_11045 [Candidatus Dadabacteria bacterium]|nr:hypothetical protein [Candidatus Dadabacteria bacterium]